MGWKDAPEVGSGWRNAPLSALDNDKLPQLENGRSMGVSALRGAEQASRGFADSALETVGAVPDMVGQVLNTIGLGPDDPRYYSNALKAGFGAVGDAVSAPLNAMLPDAGGAGPETDSEKALYGAGRGAADAASFFVPAMAASRMTAPGTLANRLSQSLAMQPVMQTAAGAVGGGVGEATGNPYLGMAAAVATPAAMAGGQRLITPVRNQLNAEESRLAKLAMNEGIKLTPAQRTGSKPLSYIESTFKDLPFTAGPQSQIDDAQRAAFNRMAMSKVGSGADTASPQALDDAFTRIGGAFDDLARKTSVVIDDQFFNQVDDVAKEYGRRLPTDVRPVFQSYLDDLNSMRQAMSQPGTNVSMIGDQYQNVASGLRRAARGAKSRPDLQDALNGLVNAVDDAMIRSADPSVAAGYREARREYRNLLAIDDAMAKGTAGSRTTGDIPFGGLTSAVRRQDPKGFARGRGEMNDVARVGDFLANKTPNSGTATRNYMTNLMTGGTAIGAGTAGYITGDPLVAAGGIAASLLGPRAAQAVYNNPTVQNYLSNQVFQNPVMTRDLVQALLAGRGKDLALNPR